jgi:hypothetical protein
MIFFGHSRFKQILLLLSTIAQRLSHMSTVQDNLDTAVANLTTVVDNAAKLLNDLNAQIQAGNQLDPARVQADVDAINAKIAALAQTVTNDSPAAPSA